MHMLQSASKRLAIITALVMMMMTVLGSLGPAHATLTSIPAAQQISSISSSNNYKGEYYKVTTPLDEKSIIYVEGKTKIPTKKFCIRINKHGTTTYFLTVFVTPDENGEFSIKINTKQGNRNVPEVIGGKGTVTQVNESFGTMPGYNAMKLMPAGTYHMTIARATTDADADVSPGTSWFSGQLGGQGGRSYAYKEVVMTVKSGQANNPKVIEYPAARSNNINTINLYEPKSYHDESYYCADGQRFDDSLRYEDIYDHKKRRNRTEYAELRRIVRQEDLQYERRNDNDCCRCQRFSGVERCNLFCNYFVLFF